MTVIAYNEWPDKFGRPARWTGIPAKLNAVVETPQGKVAVVGTERFGDVALPLSFIARTGRNDGRA